MKLEELIKKLTDIYNRAPAKDRPNLTVRCDGILEILSQRTIEELELED